MAEPLFSAQMNEALNAYVVPPVPTGFSDRLMARIARADTEGNDSPLLPAARRRPSSPWRRTSRIMGSVALFSLATATAAAAGVFGKPVYMPGISEALVEAKIVEAPAPVIKPKVRIIAVPQAVPPTDPPSSATGSAAIVSRVTELRNNPEYAKLPPRERLKIAGKEVREMVRSGEASRQDVRDAVRQLAQDADPATREAWRKAAAERREQRLARRERLRDATPEERAAFRDALRERREARLAEESE
jgi:hypothetical protein